jgi:tetratricopeptide (TPR) repeat protein
MQKSGAPSNTFVATFVHQSMIRLIDECPAYYEYADSIQDATFFSNYNKDSVLNQIQTLNQSDTANRNADFYGKITSLYFHIKQYDSAMAYANKGLLINPENSSCLLVKASVYEQENNFDEAIALYDKLLNSSNNDAGRDQFLFIMSKAIKKKKKADMNKNQNK